jgi:hypothetical protein
LRYFEPGSDQWFRHKYAQYQLSIGVDPVIQYSGGKSPSEPEIAKGG